MDLDFGGGYTTLCICQISQNCTVKECLSNTIEMYNKRVKFIVCKLYLNKSIYKNAICEVFRWFMNYKDASWIPALWGRRNSFLDLSPLKSTLWPGLYGLSHSTNKKGEREEKILGFLKLCLLSLYVSL